MRIGAHVPNADPLGAAEERGAEVVQVFLSAPQQWKKPKERADAEQLRAAELPIYVHAPYIINVATTNPKVRHPSRKALTQACEAAAAIGAAGVIVHAGHVPVDDDPEEGRANWRKTLERLETDVPVLIEDTAGGQNPMARTVEQIERLWAAIDGVEAPVGFCLDTCHLHAADAGCEGEGLVRAAERIREVVGGIDLVHVNDSKDPAGSGRDRHTNLGTGEIDPEALAAAVTACRAPDAVVETPGEAADQAADVAWLRERCG